MINKESLQKVSFNSIKREQRYYEFKLDVYRRQTNRRQTDTPGSRGGPTRGGPPKNIWGLSFDFDGYNNPSVKDQEHIRRSSKVICREIKFSENMKDILNGDDFLGNKRNKSLFIKKLADV